MTACFFSYSFIFVVAPSGREGFVLSSFCAFFFFFFGTFLSKEERLILVYMWVG